MTFSQTALKGLPIKPDDSAKQPDKKRYSELISEAVALAIAVEDLRKRWSSRKLARVHPGNLGGSGAGTQDPTARSG